jgi:hypothetical protein
MARGGYLPGKKSTTAQINNDETAGAPPGNSGEGYGWEIDKVQATADTIPIPLGNEE